ncbi:tyrosinase family protein [Trebonia kvetii]|uniref:Tyrosinase family protein n=1 Tax=Trebonia kvetii TaxID=2480626 RepID=A0A6P2C4L1_9ACTN|nr:tyrosinase family protein [Trebonia kvetii]TVZ05435.1 tyrosinase family protein [Trebonia kvetii]
MALFIRKNQADLSKAERDRFVRAVLKMKKDGIYDWYVRTHIDSMWMRNDGGMPMWAHMRPAFLPWHRQFILDFENDMRKADATLTGKTSDLSLPYWDWINFRSPTNFLFWGVLWSEDFMGWDGDGPPDNRVTKSPFTGSAWPLTFDAGPDYMPFTQHGANFLQRALGASKTGSTLPTEDEWNAALALTTYDDSPWDSNTNRKPHTAQFTGVKSFRNAFEGWIGYYEDAAAAAADPAHTPSSLHNRVHVWVGGSMSPLSSPNDPVFFLHHCNVDRLWAQWQFKNAKQPDQYLPKDGVANVTDPDGEKDPMGHLNKPELIDLQGHHLNDPMPPWDGRAATRKGLTGNMPKVAPANVLNHIKLGYKYDTDPPSLTAAGQP